MKIAIAIGLAAATFVAALIAAAARLREKNKDGGDDYRDLIGI